MVAGVGAYMAGAEIGAEAEAEVAGAVSVGLEVFDAEVVGVAVVDVEVVGVEVVGADGDPLVGGTDDTEEHGVLLRVIRD